MAFPNLLISIKGEEMFLRRILVGCMLVATVAANAADLFPNAAPRPFVIADKLEADATIGGYPIWMGEGKWRIFDLSVADSTGRAESVPIGTARLFQTEGKNWVATLDVRANLRAGTGFWLGEPCKRDNMLYKLQMASGKEDNCVTINHITHYMANPSDKAAELFALLKNEGIEYPPTVLQIQWTRNATNLRMLVYTLSINPELLGFARESEYEWARNPWNKTMSFNDPAKKQFIDALSQWATGFAKRMDDGLKQNANAFTTIPTWRTLTGGTVTTESPKPKVSLD